MEAEKMEQDTMKSSPEKLEFARSIKNELIGNKKKKTQLIHHIPALAELLSSDSDPVVLVHAISALGSFACGTRSHLDALLSTTPIIPSLLTLLKHSNQKVVEASARTLKLIYLWEGIPHEFLCDPELSKLFTSLLSSHTNTSESVLTSTCRLISRHFVSVIVESKELVKENVQECVTVLCGIIMSKQTPRVYMSALKALNAISDVFMASNVDQDLFKPLLWNAFEPQPAMPPSQEQAKNVKITEFMEKVFGFLNDKNLVLRLCAATCLASMFLANALPTSEIDQIQSKLIPILSKMMDISLWKNSEILEPSVFGNQQQDHLFPQVLNTLSTVVEDCESAEQLATENGCVEKCIELLKSQESKTNQELRASVFFCLAALTSLHEEARQQIASAKILNLIVPHLSPHENCVLKESACVLVKSLSRSVKHLRSTLVDAGIALPLIQLLDDPSLDVQLASSATLCNLVLDFAPMRKLFLEHGKSPTDPNPGISKLIDLANSENSELKVNGLWAIKNLLFRAEMNLKNAVVDHLTPQLLFQFVNDKDPSAQAQALGIMRNLFAGSTEDIQKLVEKLGGPISVVSVVQPKLELKGVENEQVIVHALFVLSNIAAGSESNKDVVCKREIMQLVLALLESKSKEVRTSALWLVINCTWKDSQETMSSVESRTSLLRELGFERKLKECHEEADLDVKDRSRQALEHLGVSL